MLEEIDIIGGAGLILTAIICITGAFVLSNPLSGAIGIASGIWGYLLLRKAL